MTALYAAVDMHTLGPMLSRPSPKLVDKLDAADIVKMLLAKGANLNARLKRPIIGRHHTPTGDASLGEGTTPLARAAKSNDLQLMRMLLDAGADPKLTLKDRTTVLMIAAAGGAVVGAYAVAIPVTEEQLDRSHQAVPRARRRRQRVQHERRDGPARGRAARGAKSRQVSGGAGRQARHEGQAGPHAARHRPWRRRGRRAAAAAATAAVAAPRARRWRPSCVR